MARSAFGNDSQPGEDADVDEQDPWLQIKGPPQVGRRRATVLHDDTADSVTGALPRGRLWPWTALDGLGPTKKTQKRRRIYHPILCVGSPGTWIETGILWRKKSTQRESQVTQPYHICNWSLYPGEMLSPLAPRMLQDIKRRIHGAPIVDLREITTPGSYRVHAHLGASPRRVGTYLPIYPPRQTGSIELLDQTSPGHVGSRRRLVCFQHYVTFIHLLSRGQTVQVAGLWEL